MFTSRSLDTLAPQSKKDVASTTKNVLLAELSAHQIAKMRLAAIAYFGIFYSIDQPSSFDLLYADLSKVNPTLRQQPGETPEAHEQRLKLLKQEQIRKNTPRLDHFEVSFADGSTQSFQLRGRALAEKYATEELFYMTYPAEDGLYATWKKKRDAEETKEDFSTWAAQQDRSQFPYTDTKVVYPLHHNQRKRFRTTVIQHGKHKGKIARGQKLIRPTSTLNLHTTLFGRHYGKCIFVLTINPHTNQPRLFTYSHERGTMQHLSATYVKADPKDPSQPHEDMQVGVLGAGVIEINRKGQIVMIKGFTGHFDGQLCLALNTVLSLKKENADLSQCKVDLRHYKQAKIETKIKAFCKEHNIDMPPLPPENSYCQDAEKILTLLKIRGQDGYEELITQADTTLMKMQAIFDALKTQVAQAVKSTSNTDQFVDDEACHGEYDKKMPSEKSKQIASSLLERTAQLLEESMPTEEREPEPLRPLSPHTLSRISSLKTAIDKSEHLLLMKPTISVTC